MKHPPPDLIQAFIQSDFWQGMLAFLGTIITAGVGLMAKVADEVKTGDRRKFFSKALWLELPVLLMMAIVAIGVAAYYDLPGPVAGGISTVFGYAGPKIVDSLFLMFLRK